ncbi:hypothetical protein [Bradyrhizobium sp. AUGA SZCCT0042]|uniref:hypothetical protein n=1 Tax=Bradyrhizobium sp. AUGA SZCCT0042 TaxID=2807651 RepID=UPI001BA56B8F|nr:hypothetical protein [Bradyrhizobium sp. AUGA SZCCT0042]MBR1300600.1 hypothetical protein [Bradyrhizobium sp. AUGA SZCCT0042]
MATIAQAAAHICCSRSQFDQYLAEGVITRQPSGQYDLDVVRREVLAHLRSVAAGRGGATGSKLTEERTRLVAAKRRREERQDALEAGRLVPIEPIERMVASSLRVIRDRLLNVPGEVAYLVAHRPQEEVYETLDGAIRETLEEIASPEFPTRVAAAGLAAAANGPHHREDADVETEE